MLTSHYEYAYVACVCYARHNAMSGTRASRKHP